jgi:hypothetical protein
VTSKNNQAKPVAKKGKDSIVNYLYDIHVEKMKSQKREGPDHSNSRQNLDVEQKS